jgi:hypothetical protein
MAYALEQDNYRSKRSYVSTGPFNSAIYTYTTALNPTTFRQEGRLALVTASPIGVALSATNCPAGRVLRENGRKLYPGVNPGLLSGDTFQGTANFQGATEAANHFWVGVFDAVTGVKGFINPNASTFTVYNSDKSLEVVDIFETNGTGVFNPNFPIRSVTALGSSGATVLTTQPVINAIVTQAATGAQALTLPATSVLLSAMGDSVGSSAEFVYINTAANAATVTAGDGSTTFVGSAVVNNASGRFLVVATSATTLVFYRT